jgi:hypothetical protein
MSISRVIRESARNLQCQSDDLAADVIRDAILEILPS